MGLVSSRLVEGGLFFSFQSSDSVLTQEPGIETLKEAEREGQARIRAKMFSFRNSQREPDDSNVVSSCQ